MKLLSAIFRRFRCVPIIMQSEFSECGLACVAMIANYYGHHLTIASLRVRTGASLRGTSLRHLIILADDLDLDATPLQVSIDDLRSQVKPAILHWDFRHFVVLARASRRYVVIHDPALGRRRVSYAEVSRHFTGVLLDLRAKERLEPIRSDERVSVFGLVPNLSTLVPSFLKIGAISISIQILAVVAPWFIQSAVNSVISTSSTAMIVPLCLGLVLVVLMQVVMHLLRNVSIRYLSASLNIKLISSLLGRLLTLPISYFEKRHVGDVMSRFGSAESIQTTLTESFMESVIDGLMVAVTLAMMYVYSVSLATVACVGVAVLGASELMLYGSIRRAKQERLIARARKDTHMLETLRGIQTIKLFNVEALRKAKYDGLLVNYLNSEAGVERLEAVPRVLKAAVFGIDIMVVVAMGAAFVLKGLWSIGALFAFLAYKQQFSDRSALLFEKMREYHLLRLHVERILDIAAYQTGIKSSPEPGGCHVESSAQLTVCDLWYRYSPGESFLLRSIGFRADAGAAVVITGPSGCGKSTLVKLLLGLLDPERGQVLFGSTDIKAFGIRRYRDCVSAVMQDDKLFAGTILENIALFSEDADVDWVHRCCEHACVLEEILDMPLQFDTQIGDMGSVLSAGQKQRIFLARALYRRPAILFLDEATSNVDVHTEQRINANLRGIGVTRVMVAHRPDTIAVADQVIQISRDGGCEVTLRREAVGVRAQQ